MRLATTGFRHNTSLVQELAVSAVKVLLSFSNKISAIADAHDARERFAHLESRQLEDIGLNTAERDYRITF